DKADPGTIVSGFRDFYVSHFDADPDEVDVSAHLQNILDIHLKSRKTREIETNSNTAVIYSFSIAALLLLFIALINYSNLTIGMAGYSDRFLYIGKVFGASNRMQLKYYLTQGIVITLISILCSSLMFTFSINYIERRFSFKMFEGNIPFVLLIVVLFSLLAVITGSLPLIRQFVNNIKSSIELSGTGSFRRKGISKGLIVAQNAISIALIITVFVIHRQTSYALNSSLGVMDANLISMSVHSEIQKHFPVFKEELLKYGSVRSVSAMLEPPGGEANDMFRFTMEGFVADETDETNDRIGIFPCDYSFASLFGLQFIGGSNFSERFSDNEGAGEYIINESAMRRLNYMDPDSIVGKGFGLFFHTDDISIPYGKIVGVVKDFHLSSLKREVEPLVLFKREKLWVINIVIAFQPGMQPTA
ncbi:hypothetical protein LCGC14_2770830, partial [marine sediment metagenome]